MSLIPITCRCAARDMEKTMDGKITKVLADKGFGFIKGEDGREYFMHRSAVRDGSVFEQLRDSQPVTFDIGQGEKGPRAENVRLA
jgi:CspA family cold shock protein